jgi:hypothetical protein
MARYLQKKFSTASLPGANSLHLRGNKRFDSEHGLIAISGIRKCNGVQKFELTMQPEAARRMFQTTKTSGT